jgi:GTPase SAR1 family protein
MVVLVGNKVDLDSKREVEFETAKTWADSENLFFYEASAKTSQNVEEVFLDTAR